MKLREYLSTAHGNGRTWPPSWSSTLYGDYDPPRGEIGILIDVAMNVPTWELLLIIEHHGGHYAGGLKFDNPSFCLQLYDLFQLHVEEAIKEIGDLEIKNP